MLKKFILKYWPVIFFIALFVLYSYPYLFQGKIPFPSSYIANELAPWNKYLDGGPVKNGIPDVGGEIYPMRSLLIDYFKNGWWPLWNPYVFSGTPFLANFQSAAFFPLNFLFLFLPKVDAWSILILLQPLLAGIFMYLFVKSLKISGAGAVFSAVAFAFCGYLTVWGSYGTMGYSVLCLPLVLFLVEKYLQNRKLIFLPLLTTVLAISFFAGHIQSFMYVFIGTVIYLLVRQWQDKGIFRKETVVIMIFILLSLLLVSVQLFPTIEFYLNSSRALAVNNAKNIGIPIQYLLTLIAPDFFGNPVTRNDWFGTYAEWMGYAGLTTLLFSLIALFNIKTNKKIWPIAGILIAGLLLSVKSPLLELISRLPIPILSNSNPSRAIVLLTFSLCVLSGFGFDYFFPKEKSDNRKSIYALGIISLAVIISVIAVFAGRYLFSPDIAENLRLISLRNLFLPILILIILWLLRLIFHFRPHLKMLLVICLLLLVVLEMFRFYAKWMPFDQRNNFYPETGITEYLKQQKAPFRFYGQFSQVPAYIEKLYGIEGYEPLNLLSYGTFINAAITGKENKSYSLDVRLQSREKYTKKTLDFLGVKYLIYDAGNFQSPFVFPVWDFQYPKIFDDGKFTVYENRDVLPRAFLAGDVKIMKNRYEIIRELFNEKFNPGNSVILEDEVIGNFDKTTAGAAEIISYQPNKVVIKTNTAVPKILVLTDNYYPGWKAAVNGKPTKIYRADYTFRALAVPKGESIVEFVYKPLSFTWGLIITLFTGFMILLVFLYDINRIIFIKKIK